MNSLSNILVNTLSHKLKINFFPLKEEKNYNFNISKLIFELSESELNKNIKLQSSLLFNDDLEKNKKNWGLEQDFVISYIITITFSKTNTMIHVSDSLGNVKWFCSSGSLGITGKRKKQRRSVVLKLIFLLIKKTDFLFSKPIALHLNNVSSYQTFIIKKLKKQFFIKIVKSYNQIPYNGCRQKKVRRKKYSKNFK